MSQGLLRQTDYFIFGNLTRNRRNELGHDLGKRIIGIARLNEYCIHENH